MSAERPDEKAGQSRTDPAVKDTIERLRATADDLNNGEAGNIEKIGHAVKDLCYLQAHEVEANRPTGEDCVNNQKAVCNYIDRRLDKARHGINWPMAFAAVSAIGMICGVTLKLFG